MSKETINWLHLTDLHMGQSGQAHLWPNLRSEFERDLSNLMKITGPIDLIFFTGDLVQSGERKQYELLESALIKLWAFFLTNGSTPKLVVVPGNHDIQRPDSTKSSTMALSGWHTNSTTRKVFWDNPKSDIRKTVVKCFDEYQRWKNNTNIPILTANNGLIPGDFAVTFSKGKVKIGIAGLNSSFLQITNADAEKKLVLSTRQLHSACADDCAAWSDAHNFNILLTHHPKSWLCDDALEEFNRDIVTNGRFRMHLHGHLHESSTLLISEGGSTPMLTHQGRSLFGLEIYGVDKKEKRQHGYLLGQWILNDLEVDEKLWPRIAVLKSGGAIGLVPNPSEHLESDGSINYKFRGKPLIPEATKSAESIISKDIADYLISNENLSEKILKFPKFTNSNLPQHQAIRGDERAILSQSLKETRKAAILADWGTGKDGFIASVIKPEDSTEAHLNFEDRIFHLRCDTFENIAELEQGFITQLGVTTSDFPRCFTPETQSCLLLDGLQPNHTGGQYASKLEQLIDLLLDYTPSLSIILIGRSAPVSGFNQIEIKSLDLPDFRLYIEKHTDFQGGPIRQDFLETLFEIAGGLPIAVDRILSKMRLASFDAVIEEENELTQNFATEIPLHKALQKAIESARRQDNQNNSRAIKLLKTLSLLAYGETIEQLKHFHQREPLFTRDVKTLDEASLIDIIPLQTNTTIISSQANTGASWGTGMKLLRIPKQVRDCVIASLSSDETKEILIAASEFYFGKGWRIGKKIKLRKIPIEYRDYIAHGPGNEYCVIQLMIARAKEASDRTDLKASVRLGMHYCGVLKGSSRNRDLRIVSQNLLRLLDGTNLQGDICELNRLCGRACRLTGHHDEAVKYFKASLDQSAGKLPQDSRQYALIEMSDSLKVTGDIESAKKSVNEALNLSKPDSLSRHQAEAKILMLESESPEQLESIKKMEDNARNNGWISHANDLRLIMQSEIKDFDEKIKCLDIVLNSEADGQWNKYRAIVEKCILLIRSRKFDRITIRDRVSLQQAYSYCYSQRINLFDRCHEAIWSILENESRYEQLCRLFLHSSFIWRIRGDVEIETRYFERLHAHKDQLISNSKTIFIEIRYFTKRSKVLLARIASLSKNKE